MTLPKVVVLLGPTASGKTKWGLQLAQEFQGEIISADSRQIYKKMNIGTAKEPGEWRRRNCGASGWLGHKAYYIEDIPHHLIDIIDPGKLFSVAEWREQALERIKKIQERGHVPFLVGGTGLYITALVDNLLIPRLAPNKKLRQSLAEKPPEELLELLRLLDPEAAKRIDPKNIRRVIRALEVSILTGNKFSEQQQKGEPLFDILQIGIDIPKPELYRRIDTRIEEMIAKGLVEEVKKLRQQKYDWSLPSMSGIGYRQLRAYVEGDTALPTVIEQLKRDTHHFARRQIMWFRRDKRIQWVKDYGEAQKLVKEFLG